MNRFIKIFNLGLILFPLAFFTAHASLKEGQKVTFKLFLFGKEIGYNTYVVSKKDAEGYHIRSKTLLKVTPEMTFYESSLLSERLIPKRYDLNVFVGNLHQWIRAQFEKGKVALKFNLPGKKEEKEVELKIERDIAVLDNNVINHWDLLAKRYDYQKGGKQVYSVVVPQVAQSLSLSLEEVGTEEVQINGQKRLAVHLSGSLADIKAELWVDRDSHDLLKLAIPSQNFKAVWSSKIIDFSEEETSQRLKALQEGGKEERFVEEGYRSQAVTFISDTLKLAGTLTLPDTSEGAKLPALLLLPGSGAVDRDENAGVLRSYFLRQLADTLSKAGFITFRYDKRGVGESQGDFAKADLKDLINDAEAALSYLKAHPMVKEGKVGIIGHSEGAIIGPIIASQDEEVAALVIMAGTARPLDQVFIDQMIYLMKLKGIDREEIQKAVEKQKEVFKKIRRGESVDFKTAKGNPDWWRQHMENNPLEVIKRVSCPILIMNGGKDYQISSKKDAQALDRALEEVEHPDHTLRIYPDLDHLFVRIEGQSTPEKYLEPSRRIDRQVLADLVAWLKERLAE